MTKGKTLIKLEYGGIQALYWAGYCACSAYAAVFLKHHGYSNSELGIIMAVGNIFGFIFSPVFAAYVDRVKKAGYFGCCLFLLGVELAFVLSFFFIAGKALLITIGYSIYLGCVLCVNPLNTQFCFMLEEHYGHINYGAARSFGSVAYAPTSLLMGALVELVGAKVLLIAATIIISLQIALLLLFIVQSRRFPAPVYTTQLSQEKSSSLPRFFAENIRFCLLMFGTAFLFFSHSLVCSFMINLVNNVNGDTSQMGAINALTACAEMPAMIFYDRLSRRFKCSSILRFAAIMFIAKCLSFAFATSVAGLYFSCLLQAVSFGLLTPACVNYVNLKIAHKDTTKGQSLSMAAVSLGFIFACSIGGMLYDKFSVFMVLIVGSSAALVGAMICWLSTETTQLPHLHKNPGKA